MKKITWDYLIKNDISDINLIGYGSLLNKKTIFDDTKILEFVEAKGFKRTYNLPYEEDKWISATEKSKKVLSKEEWNGLKNPICGKDNDGALNCRYTGKEDDYINGLLINIKNTSFQEYKNREYLYDLYETSFDIVNPENGKRKQSSKKAYILIAKHGFWIKNSNPYEAYHMICRKGAYELGNYFGKVFDDTTYNGTGNILIKNIYPYSNFKK